MLARARFNSLKPFGHFVEALIVMNQPYTRKAMIDINAVMLD